MNEFCVGMRDLKINVPNDIITAYYEALEFCKEHNYKKSLQENWNYFSWYLQDVSEKHRRLLDNPTPGLEDRVEHLKIFNVWITECPAIVKIRDFLTSHFSSCFHARIANLPAGSYVDIHDPHAWPRIFVPMHDNECDFCIVEDGKLHTARFEVGSMYLFDVRKFHGTFNKGKTDRYMGAFYIDPRVETITKIEGLN